MDIEEFEKGFAHDPDHERNVRNSYQADRNQNHWTSEEYYLWTRDHTRLEMAIGPHGVDYLADEQRQTTTEMMNTLQDVKNIKPLERHEIALRTDNDDFEKKVREALARDQIAQDILEDLDNLVHSVVITSPFPLIFHAYFPFQPYFPFHSISHNLYTHATGR